MTKQNEPYKDRFDEAVAKLPQCRTDRKDKSRRTPRCFWEVECGGAETAQGRPSVLGNYTIECFLGAALWERFVVVLREYPDLAQSLIRETLQDMVARGRLSGVEVAFLGALSREISVGAARPRFTVVDGGAA